MSNTTTKPWYQNGGIALLIAGIVAFVLFEWLNPKKQFVEIEMKGGVNTGLLGDDTLTVNCWHIFPGTLEKGRISVTAEGMPIPMGLKTEHYSF